MFCSKINHFFVGITNYLSLLWGIVIKLKIRNYDKRKEMKYYILSEYQGNVGVEYVADTEHEANNEMARRKLLWSDLFIWVEASVSEPTCVTL